MMNKKELKNLDVLMLEQEISSLKKELFNLKLNRLTGQIKDVSQYRKIRAQIARAFTFLKQKQQ